MDTRIIDEILAFGQLQTQVAAAARAHGVHGDPLSPDLRLGTYAEEIAAIAIFLDVPKHVRRDRTYLAHQMARATVRSRRRGRR